MNGDAGDDGSQTPRASGGPRGPIGDSLAKPRKRRFYSDVSVATGDGAHRVLLDGRPVKTPAKRVLALPTSALADAIASEWASQSAEIDPAAMPMTRFANTAIDAVADSLQSVADDIAAYAGSDLLCYRAEAPAELIGRQARVWNPIVAWARDDLGAPLDVVAGVMPVEQPRAAIAAIAAALQPHDAFRLTALHVLTTLTGSAILALAYASGRLSADDAWVAAHVDEDHQIALWGEDYEAAERRKLRRAEFDAAARFLAARG